jgi:GTPase SAR1 family protein
MKGQFVGIFGDVGSGKTSLLSALIGDLRYIPKDFAESNIEKKLEEDMKLIDEIDQ